MKTMTSAERETLVKIIRQRERVAKGDAKERAARLVADFERQMDTRYSYDENEVWEKAVAAAEFAVREAKVLVQAECDRLGIPRAFAPCISMGWHESGRNESRRERGEMRRVAMKQIEAIEKAARSTIERRSVEAQEAILVGSLTSDDAKQFLEAIPTVEALMPPIEMEKVKVLLLKGGRQ